MHSINMVISHIRMVLATECAKPAPKCRAYMMLIGNYGGHMAFTMDPPYCIAYAAEYKHTDDPSRMTFHANLPTMASHDDSKQHGGTALIVHG